jgi:RHS repeat-associated protein
MTMDGVVTDGRRSNYVRDSSGTLIGQFTEGGEPLFAVTDYQGSTLLLVDANPAEAARYNSTPYGETTKSGRAADANPFRWIGAWEIDDAHGTYLVGHRQHDPKLARFTQPDPSGKELNRYGYGMANPITNTDPTGLLSAVSLDQTIGAGIGTTVIGGGIALGCVALAVACAGLALTAAVVFGAAGGGLGAAIAGGTDEDIADGVALGAIAGAIPRGGCRCGPPAGNRHFKGMTRA